MKNRFSWILKSFVVIIIFTSFNPFFVLATDSDAKILIIQGEVDNEHLDNRKTDSIENSNLEMVSVQFQGFLGMIAPGETIVTMPAIAESWTHNEDFTEWTFIIREGAKFHDGSPINARAVKYSIVANCFVILKEWFGFTNISEVANWMEEPGFFEIKFPASDPNGFGREITISWDEFPFPLFELFISGGAMDAKDFFILVPYNSHGAVSDNSSICQAKIEVFSQLPISAGPYKVSKFVVGEYILLERFNDWFGWGQRIIGSDGKEYTFPKKEIAYEFVKYVNVEVREVNNVIEGKVDIFEDWKLSKLELEDYNKTKNIETVVKSANEASLVFINHQGDWPTFYDGPGNFPLSQVWFRQAVSNAIDRSLLVSDTTASEFDKIYPNSMIKHFPDLNTDDFYDFDQGMLTAGSILDENKFTPLGFDEEPNNRFGYGMYANETDIGGIEQTKGRHFLFLTYNENELEAEIIQQNLQEVGIYIDILAQDKEETRHQVREGVITGWDYNVSYYPEPDPDFRGPDWDFFMPYSLTIPCENPWGLPQLTSIVEWLFNGYGINGGWYNPTFELALARSFGDDQGISTIAWKIPGIVPENISCPEWQNNDSQFIEASEIIGQEMSRELPFIPLTWLSHAYIMNSQVKNLIVNGEGFFHVAYAIHESNVNIPYPFFPINILALMVFRLISNKKRRK